MPAIALLKKHCKVINVDGGVDHRLRKLEKTELYHSPLNSESYASVAAIFDSLRASDTSIIEDTQLNLAGRTIAVEKLSGDIVWFDFHNMRGAAQSK